MAVPAAPAEAGGNSILFLTHDVAGTNTPGVMRGIVPRTVNGTILSYQGIATHADGATWVSGDPVVLNGVYESGSPGTIRKMKGDATGRVITQPLGVYNSGGTNAFGHPLLVGGAALNGEQAGWLASASHADAAAFGAGNGIQVIGGVDVATARKMKVDGTGRILSNYGYIFGGSGHVDVAAGPNRAQLHAGLACAMVRVKADKGNANTLYVGTVAVTANEAATTGGYQLEPGEWTEIPATNLNLIYIHGIAGQGASYMYFT